MSKKQEKAEVPESAEVPDVPESVARSPWETARGDLMPVRPQETQRGAE